MSELASRLRFALLALVVAVSGCVKARVEEQCQFNGDCAGQLVCSSGFCREQCRADADCPGGSLCVTSADPTKSVCLTRRSPRICWRDSECGLGRICTHEGVCSPECRTSRDCASLTQRAVCTPARYCLLPLEDADAGLSCGGGSLQCGATCVDLRSDPQNCGACAAACTSSQLCQSGSCVEACLGGAVLCGTSCVAVATNAQHCGQCGRACSASHAEAAWCESGACKNLCAAPFLDCDGDGANGCETDGARDPAHCGACSVECGASESCVGARCRPGTYTAHWSLDATTRDAVSGLELSLANATFAQGALGQGLRFSGLASQYAQRTGNDPSLDLQGDTYTVSLWFRLDSLLHEQTLLDKCTGVGPGWSITATTANTIEFYFNGDVVTVPASLSVGRWHQLVLRKDALSKLTAFYDGQRMLTVDAPAGSMGIVSLNPLRIGRRNDGDTRVSALSGTVDELSFSPGALADSAILAEYQRVTQ